MTETGHGGDGESSKYLYFIFFSWAARLQKPSGGRDQLLFEGVAGWRWNWNVVKTELVIFQSIKNALTHALKSTCVYSNHYPTRVKLPSCIRWMRRNTLLRVIFRTFSNKTLETNLNRTVPCVLWIVVVGEQMTQKKFPALASQHFYMCGYGDEYFTSYRGCLVCVMSRPRTRIYKRALTCLSSLIQIQ